MTLRQNILWVGLSLLLPLTAFPQSGAAVGTRENPRISEAPAASLPAVVVYREAMAQERGRLSAPKLEARVKQLLDGHPNDPEWETAMGHQLSMLASSLAGSGEARVAVALGQSAIEHYERAEAAMNRGRRSSRERAELITHIGNVQDRILGETAAARETYGRAVAADAGAELARRNLDRLDDEARRKEKPNRSGDGG